MIQIITKKSGKVIRSLTPKEQYDIHPNRRGSDSAQKLLQELHEAKHDLLCHCKESPALMYLRCDHLKTGDVYRLVCHAKKGRHRKSCEHYREISGSIVNDPDRTGKAIAQQNETFQDFSLFNDFATPTTSDNKQPTKITKGKRANSGAKVHKLVNLARYLIREAGLNVVRSDHCYTTPNEALDLYCRAGQGIEFGGSTLNDWIVFGPRAYRAACAKLHRVTEAGNWTSPGRPHAFVVALAKDVTIEDDARQGKQVKLVNFKDENETPIPAKRVITDGPGLRSGGPYLVFYTLTKYRETDRHFRSHTVFIKPVAHERMIMPVDSDHERRFANQLAYLINQSQNWTLTKGMEGRNVDDCFVLPDFLLEGPQTRHIVEIMGMLNKQEYVDRKDYIVPLMAKGWPGFKTIELDPNSKDVRRYLQKLT